MKKKIICTHTTRTGDLAEIAQELDQQERDMMMEAGLDTSDGESPFLPFLRVCD
jgi:hypothetical protein